MVTGERTDLLYSNITVLSSWNLNFLGTFKFTRFPRKFLAGLRTCARKGRNARQHVAKPGRALARGARPAQTSCQFLRCFRMFLQGIFGRNFRVVKRAQILEKDFAQFTRKRPKFWHNLLARQAAPNEQSTPSFGLARSAISWTAQMGCSDTAIAVTMPSPVSLSTGLSLVRRKIF